MNVKIKHVKKSIIVTTLLFFSLHLFWLLRLLLVHGKNWLVIPFWIATVCWFTFLTILFYCLQQDLYRKYHSNVGLAFSIIFSFILYCYVITYYSLVLCGVCEGYPFFNPLVLLAYWPQLLWCLKYLGFIGTLTFLTGLTMFAALGFVQAKKYLWGAVLCSLPFLAGFFFYQPHAIKLNQSCFVKPWWHKSKDPMFVGYRMVHDITEIMCKQSDIATIIMPESSFGWDLYEYKQFIDMMCDYREDVSILFGSQRCVDGHLYNSYFMVRNGQIVFEYDKQHLVPLMERRSYFLDWVCCSELLCSKQDVFAYGSAEQNDVISIDDQEFQLFVCSEFLYEAKSVKGLPVLFVCNDAWFLSDYLKGWILLFIKYFELRYDVPVVFGTVTGSTNINS